MSEEFAGLGFDDSDVEVGDEQGYGGCAGRQRQGQLRSVLAARRSSSCVDSLPPSSGGPAIVSSVRIRRVVALPHWLRALVRVRRGR